MKTKTSINQIINHSSIDPALIRAVVRQFGGIEQFNDQFRDVANHGIDGGFSGFIYHSDTVKFAKKNKKLIMALAKDQARDFGVETIEMLKGFNCFKGVDVEAYFMGWHKDDETTILNGLAWYAGEEVCRVAQDIIENQ